MPPAVALTVIVAKPPVKSNSAVATGLPSGVARFAVSFLPLLSGAADDGPEDGDEEPVQTDGGVPSVLLAFWFGLQALSANAGTANRTAATVADLTMQGAYPVTITMTPGGRSTSSGARGTGGAAFSTLAT